MPSYFYCLKFELYSTSAPTASSSHLAESSPGLEASGDVWLPPKNADVFNELPGHQRPAVQPARNQHREPTHPLPSIEAQLQPSLIDCGAPRPTQTEDVRNNVVLSERQRLQLRQRTASFPPPQSYAAIKPEVATRDWRFDRVQIESLDVGSVRAGNHTDMAGDGGSTSTAAAAAVGPSMSSAGKATKARFVPFKTKTTEIGWGVVHLYREGNETPELASSPNSVDEVDGGNETLQGIDCTTLCIPAVPSYLSPSDFLGFVGDKWRDQISHYRLVMTGRMNRYLVLLKFRESEQARQFRAEYDGKVFNDIEPETCNVAFIRSITFETPGRADESFPDLSHDPFTPPAASTPGTLKPFPPPTPDLIELPTCPVCLERMDDTTGLLTIPCQHVFHCLCLQKWKGSGCPVCRHTNPSLTILSDESSVHNPYSSSDRDSSNPYSQPFGSHITNLCATCDSTDDLWICLICGNVGCGRYKGGHAKEHWKDTAHTFALELDTQHVWDYAGDMWVHRLIRDKGDSKVIELPGHQNGHQDRQEDQDVVPRAKLDTIGMEYTHLLTSQLESQRVYFEEMLSKAADKAAKAAIAAESAASQASEALRELRALKEDHRLLKADIIPSLEKDLDRERTRAAKSTDLARNLGKNLQEEKKVSEGLMKRIEHVNKELVSLSEQVKTLEMDNADLKDQIHDLTMFISGQEKLKEMEAEGQVAQEELEEGSASVPESRRRRGKGKGKT